MARLIHLLFAVILSVVCLPAEADAQERTARLGVLWPVYDDPILEAFRGGLREFGYVEGRTVAIEYRFAEGNDALLPELAAELLERDIDVLVTWGVTAARAAVAATTTIPIVNGSMSDPVRAGLVSSFARPGGNLTGLTSSTPELSAKRLELMTDVVPGLARVGVLATPHPTAQFGLRESEAAAAEFGLTLQVQEIEGPEDFDGAFKAMSEARAQALIVLADLMFNQHIDRVVGLSAAHSLPTVYFSRDFVDAGGLMSYAPSFADQFRRAAGYVDKILKGADPAELAIERAARFELVINITAARELDLDLPASVLARADEVIE